MISFQFVILQEGKTVKAGGGGFGGRGFKFDETEASLANDRKKVQAAALGITQDGEEGGTADVSLKLSKFIIAVNLTWSIRTSLDCTHWSRFFQNTQTVNWTYEFTEYPVPAL